MKRLFQLIDSKTKKPVSSEFFSDKMAAKAARRTMNGPENEARGEFRVVIGLGPDHRRHNTNLSKETK